MTRLNQTATRCFRKAIDLIARRDGAHCVSGKRRNKNRISLGGKIARKRGMGSRGAKVKQRGRREINFIEEREFIYRMKELKVKICSRVRDSLKARTKTRRGFHARIFSVSRLDHRSPALTPEKRATRMPHNFSLTNPVAIAFHAPRNWVRPVAYVARARWKVFERTRTERNKKSERTGGGTRLERWKIQ